MYSLTVYRGFQALQFVVEAVEWWSQTSSTMFLAARNPVFWSSWARNKASWQVAFKMLTSSPMIFPLRNPVCGVTLDRTKGAWQVANKSLSQRLVVVESPRTSV